MTLTVKDSGLLLNTYDCAVQRIESLSSFGDIESIQEPGTGVSDLDGEGVFDSPTQHCVKGEICIQLSKSQTLSVCIKNAVLIFSKEDCKCKLKLAFIVQLYDGCKLLGESASSPVAAHFQSTPSFHCVISEELLRNNITVSLPCNWSSSFENFSNGSLLKVSVLHHQNGCLLGKCTIPIDDFKDSAETFFPLVEVNKPPEFDDSWDHGLSTKQPAPKSIIHSPTTFGCCSWVGRWKKISLSFRTIILLLTTILLVVAIGVPTTMAYYSGKQQLEKAAFSYVEGVAAGIGARLDAYFGVPEISVAVLGQNLEIQNTSDGNRTLTRLHSSLLVSRANNVSVASEYHVAFETGVFFGAFISEVEFVTQEMAESRLLCSAPYAENVTCQQQETDCLRYNSSNITTYSNFSVTERPWYPTPLPLKKATWSSVFTSYIQGFPAVTVSYPLLSPGTGTFLGLVGSWIPLQNLSNYLSTLPYYKSGVSYLVETSTGRLFATSRPGTVIMVPAASSSNGYIRDSASHLEFSRQADITLNSGGLVVRSHRYSRSTGIELIIVVVIPYSDFNGSFNLNVLISVCVAFAVFAAFITICFLFINHFSAKLKFATHMLSEYVSLKFGNERLPPEVYSVTKEIARLYEALHYVRSSLLSFVKYVPPSLVKAIMTNKDPAHVSSKRCVATVFHSDIAEFTTISENLSLEELNELMGAYLEEMTAIIMKHHGYVDKFVGDGIMALWNAPEAVKDHALEACYAALEYQQRLNLLSQECVARGYHPIRARIGIHTGKVIVGNFGNDERLNYTAIGEAVSLTSRLESLNKEYGTSIIISEDTYRMVRNQILCRPLGMTVVRGEEKVFMIFEPKCLVSQATIHQIEDVRLFARGLDCMRLQHFQGAINLFSQYLREHPEDQCSRIHMATCVKLMKEGMPKNWEPSRAIVIERKSKQE